MGEIQLCIKIGLKSVLIQKEVSKTWKCLSHPFEEPPLFLFPVLILLVRFWWPQVVFPLWIRSMSMSSLYICMYLMHRRKGFWVRFVISQKSCWHRNHMPFNDLLTFIVNILLGMYNKCSFGWLLLPTKRGRNMDNLVYLAQSLKR